jgi:PPOX class probable F420-dependent enzyme
MLEIPVSLQDLLADESRSIGFLATIMADGTPQVTPVWFDVEDEFIRVNTVKGRTKSVNMLERPAFAMAIVKPGDPYRYLQLRGSVASMTSEGAVEHTHRLAQKYLGEAENPWYHNEPRQMFRLKPESFDYME